MEPFDMYYAESFDEASDLIVEHGAKPISGGTALATMMKEQVFQPDVLVNLRHLQEAHDYIDHDGDEIRIGALTRLRTLEQSELLMETIPEVSNTASKIASIRIRNVATIGGNLAHADPDLDMPPLLAGLGAKIVVHGRDGDRVHEITDFVEGYYQTKLDQGELIKEIRIPVREGVTAKYHKHQSLSEADWPTVGVAAVSHEESDDAPVVFMNCVADTPIFQVEGLDNVFSENSTTEAIEQAGEMAHDQCDPIGDNRGSAWYKRRMAQEFTERALRDVTGVKAEQLGSV